MDLLTEQVKAEKKTKDGIFSHISKNKQERARLPKVTAIYEVDLV